MKKIIFSCTAAISLVITLSAFHGKQTSYYWFNTSNAGQPVATNPQSPTTYTGIHSSSFPCPGSIDYCQLGYTEDQLNFEKGVPVSVKANQTGVEANENL
jgi:hypothetical protein